MANCGRHCASKRVRGHLAHVFLDNDRQTLDIIQSANPVARQRRRAKVLALIDDLRLECSLVYSMQMHTVVGSSSPDVIIITCNVYNGTAQYWTLGPRAALRQDGPVQGDKPPRHDAIIPARPFQSLAKIASGQTLL